MLGRIVTTEPHPTVPQNSYTHSGRGGAGNHFRAPVTTPSSGVPTYTAAAASTIASTTHITSSSSAAAAATSGRFYSGRGGAGNAQASAPLPTLSFDEECARAEARSRRTMAGHVGRGGAGNTWGSSSSSSSSSSPSKKHRKDSDASSSSCSSSGGSRRDSASTEGSVRATGFLARLNVGGERAMRVLFPS